VDVPAPDAETVLITCRKRRAQPGGDSGKTLHETGTWRWVYQEIAKSKLMGLEPRPGSEGRLKKLKAVKILGDNYGLALDPEPQVIRFHKVWPQLNELRQKNGGKPVRVLRNGQLIRLPDQSRSHKGLWRVFSVKENADGLALALGQPDALVADKAKPNVLVRQLTKNGMTAEHCALVGINSIGVAYCAIKRRQPKPKPASDGP
jgi:hypothetical protein